MTDPFSTDPKPDWQSNWRLGPNASICAPSSTQDDLSSVWGWDKSACAGFHLPPHGTSMGNYQHGTPGVWGGGGNRRGTGRNFLLEHQNKPTTCRVGG